MNINLENSTTTQPDNDPIDALANELLNKFVTRHDAYAAQNPSGDYRLINGNISVDDVAEHLEGSFTCGVYLLNKQNKVKVLVLDIDLDKSVLTEMDAYRPALQDTARRCIKACRGLGLDPVLEDSGNKGYHILLFFEEETEAALARKLGKQIVEAVGILPDKVNIEIFPKQDQLKSEDSYGNLIKLPCGIHLKSGRRSELLDPETFSPVNDALDTLQGARLVSQDELQQIVGAATPSSVPLTSTRGTGIQTGQDGLERMVEHCPIIRMFEANPVGWKYDHWLGVGSDYSPFNGGWERFVEFSKKDIANFSQYEIDRIHDEVLAFHGPQTYEKFRDQGLKFDLPANAPKSPAGWGSWNDPIASPIREENGCYGKTNKDGFFIMLTPFTIDTKYLLDFPDGDVLTCKIKHVTGREWDNITIENTDWHTRGKLMKALKHSECTFHGSDLDAIDLCQNVVSKVQVRKQGTRVIGLVDDTWVVRDCNLTAAGILEPMKITPYDKSSDSLHARIRYHHLPDAAYRNTVQTFFKNILQVNQPEVMLPLLGWFFAVPLKPRIMDKVGSFPVLFCYGTQGGGKTSLLQAMLSLCGYDDPTVSSCTMKEFPLLKLVSSTNAVPIVLDEFKPYDMKNGQVMTMSRFIRKVYRGEVEDKGNADQTITQYHLQAPVVVSGEAKLKEAAVLERLVIAGFTDAIKRSDSYRTAFHAMDDLDLQGFMDRYIPFCLSVDFDLRWADAEKAALTGLKDVTVAPRILNNLTTMCFGLALMVDYAKQWGIDLSQHVDLDAAMANQVEEITGNGRGQVKLAVDHFFEQLARMVEKGFAVKEVEFTFTKMKDNILGKKIDPDKKYLAVYMSGAVPTFIANVGRLGYVGEMSDEDGYRKHLSTRDYVIETDHQKHFKPYGAPKKGINRKCVIIDLEAAEKAGLDVGGFFSIAQTCNDDAEDAKAKEKKTEPIEKLTEELPL